MGHVHPDDEALIEALRAGERQAFDRFFEAYFKRLYRFVRIRVGDEAACEDIVQETLIKALRGLHGFRGDAAFFTWLCQIARSQMNTWYQRNGRHIQNETPLEDDDGGWQDGILLNRTDDAEVTHNLVLRTLAGLPENYRGVLEMKYFDGLSVSQIAGLLATGEVAVQSLLARARKAFRTGFNTLTENATP